jgi:hypothetical protein
MSRQYVQLHYHEESLTLHTPSERSSPSKSSLHSQLQLTADMGSLGSNQTKYVVKLSPIDQIQPRGYIRIILCFPLKELSSISSISQSLELALNATISRWPIFGGTVGLSNDGIKDGRLEVRYSNPPNHAQLHVKVLTSEEFPYTYVDLSESGMPLLPMNEVLLCSVPPVPQSSSPVPAALAQANFISGGLLLSICLHHGVTDGRGAFLFISAFSDACRSGGTATSIPCIDPTSLRRTEAFHASLEGAPGSHLAYKSLTEGASLGGTLASASEDSITNRLFVFSNARLKQLKESLMAHLPDPVNEWVSTNDCLAALLWSTITRARLPNIFASNTSSFAVAVDVRKRANPPLSPTYAGAAVVHSIATSDIPVLTDASTPSQLAQLALKIRKSLHAVDNEYISQTVSLSEAFPDVREFGFKIAPVYGPDLILTSWKDFSYYGLDFGELGKPQWARKPWSRHAAVIVVLPKDKSVEADRGLEVILLLREDDMDRLMDDTQFMQWVKRVVE